MQQRELLLAKNSHKQDHQALLKAKYCPLVAAASRTLKKNPKSM